MLLIYFFVIIYVVSAFATISTPFFVYLYLENLNIYNMGLVINLSLKIIGSILITLLILFIPLNILIIFSRNNGQKIEKQNILIQQQVELLKLLTKNFMSSTSKDIKKTKLKNQNSNKTKDN